jgi:hypothetical protein
MNRGTNTKLEATSGEKQVKMDVRKSVSFLTIHPLC